jgi:hypothetical protein
MQEKVQIEKVNKLTESEESELTGTTVGQKWLAKLIRHGYRGITIVNVQMNFLFNSLFLIKLIALSRQNASNWQGTTL